MKRFTNSLLLLGTFGPAWLVGAQQNPAPAAPTTAPATASAPAPVKAPFPYVWGEAYHILPETHTDESGYFSIIEGNDGKIYVGTAKYNINGYLVEFDPQTQTQKIVVDTNKVNGLTATGYAAQSKIHTRNFVGPSGTVYVGSQEGYRNLPGDESVYPGGYVMAYDPKTQKARSLGMPMKGEGVIDVVADEARGLLYAATSWGDDKKSHWMISDIAGKSWRELGPLPTNYASTLMDSDGRAHVITADSKLATYDPRTGKTSLRPIILGGKPWARGDNGIPTWQLTPDRKAAYVILMNDPALLKLDFGGKGAVKAQVLGAMLAAKNTDSRSSLTVAPDGRVYALIKEQNQTGFGTGNLHHLTRYDPKTKKTQDLGVLAVKNPDFFDFGPRADGSSPPWSHGYHTLPDGVMTPLHGHQGLIAARDGSLYALILYPYTLLHIPAQSVGVKPVVAPTVATKPLKPVAAVAPYARQYMAFGRAACDQVEADLPAITRVAEIVADRHLKGGLIGFPWNSQGLQQELAGRAGSLMHIGFNRPWQDRSPDGDKNNVAIIGWDRAPGGGDLDALQKLRDAGTYIVGFGPRTPELAPHIALCDAYFDTKLGADDRMVTLPNGEKAGRGNLLVNMLNGWAFTGEIVAALTRRGVMPPLWKAWMFPDGREWSDKYFGKTQFQQDVKIAPIAAQTLSRAYLKTMRQNIADFEASESAKITRASDLIASEFKDGDKTIVATQGHAPWTYVGFYEDKIWAAPVDFDATVPAQVEAYGKTPVQSLVFRLGYGGLNADEYRLMREKEQRVILMSIPDPRPQYAIPDDLLLFIDLKWPYGDAVVPIEGYPIKALPPSGVMQVVGYEAVNVEVLARLGREK